MKKSFRTDLRTHHETETILMIYNLYENSIVNLTIYCILENVY